MRTRYSIRALVSETVDEVFMASPVSMYTWDQNFNFTDVEDLFQFKNLAKICNLLVCSDFLAKFYDKIIEKNRRFSYYYRTVLGLLLYHVQHETFLTEPEFKKPSLVYVEGYENADGQIVKYPYVNEDFNYTLIINSMDKN